MKIVIANGPPFSGKDTFVDYLATIFPGAVKVRFKDVLYDYSYKHWDLADHGMSYDEWVTLCNHVKDKDLPHPLLGYETRVGTYTPRQALIHVSEDILKVKYGPDAVAVATVELLKSKYPNYDKMVFLFSDGGFNNEIKALMKAFGISRRDLYIFRIDRKGCNFNGDSREYIRDFNEHLRNNSTIKDFHDEIRNKFRFIVLTDRTWPIPLISKKETLQ